MTKRTPAKRSAKRRPLRVRKPARATRRSVPGGPAHSAGPSRPATAAGLEARIRRIASRLEGSMGVCIHHLARGETVAIDAERSFQMASVFKIPILAELMSEVAAGRRSLAEQIELTEEMKAPGSGVLKELSPGIRLSVRDLATLMIIVSDNTATDILLGLVGKDAVNARLAALGLTRTTVAMNCRELLHDLAGLSGAPDTPETRRLAAERLKRRELDWTCRVYTDERANMTTPREMGALLEHIARSAPGGRSNGGPPPADGALPRLARDPRPPEGGLLPAEACRLMLDIMRRQQVRDRLPLLLPPGAELAHKTGSVTRVSNDAGVLFTREGPCVVAVFTRDLADDLAGRRAIAEVGRAVYDRYPG